MLSVKKVSKIYKTKGGVVTKALDDVSIDFPKKGMIFLLGRSGSGKSTLLNVIGGLDKPDYGEVIIKGKSSRIFSTTDFDSYRNTFIGFIFQEYNILNEFNVEQNIGLALQLQGKKADKQKIEQILEQVDLKGVAKRKPNTLSGGQKQRIAIARALIKEPQIIMADEPTGALDSNTGKQVFDTLKKLSQEKLVIVVSHDREFAKQYGDRIIELKDGKVISDDTKEYLEAKKKNTNYTIGENGVIQISNGSKLSAADLKIITNEIKKSKGEVIISNSKENNDDIRRTLKIRDDGSSEVFNTTKKVELETYEGHKTTFIKSRMPIIRAFKMGASSLKTKPIRLAFTILLSSISFAMFGIVSTFMLYDPVYSFSQAIKQMDYKTDNVNKMYTITQKYIDYDYKKDKITSESSGTTTSKTYFGINEVGELNKKSNKFVGVFNTNNAPFDDSVQNRASKFDIKVSSDSKYADLYAYNVFDGFSDCGEEFAKNNFNLQGKYPASVDEVAISNYTADLIRVAQNISTYEDLINKKVDVKVTLRSNYASESSKEVSLKVVGICHIDTIPERYLDLTKDSSEISSDNKDKLKGVFNNFITNGLFLTGFVTKDFYATYKDYFAPITNSYSYEIPNVWGNGIRLSEYEIESTAIISEDESTQFCDKQIIDAVKYNGKFQDLNGEEKSFNDIQPKEGECLISTARGKASKLYYKDCKGNTGELKVIGYYNSTINSGYIVNPSFTKNYVSQNSSIYYNSTETKYELPNDARYTKVMLKTQHSDEDIKIMIQESPTYFYEMGNKEYESVKSIVSMVTNFRQIFFYVGIATGALAALLLVNFISVSISTKKKDIGILRAVGAKGGDVFKIFYSESSVISLICFVISSIGAGVACYFLNSALANEFAKLNPTGAGVSVINFGLLNLLIVLGASILITFLATFIPVMIAAKKPPVESIRAL